MTNMQYKFILLIFGLPLILLFSCKKETEDPEKTNPTTTVPRYTVSFQKSVLPVFNTNCNGGYCHGGSADGKSFVSHTDVILINPVTLLGAINHTAGFSPMPKSQPKLMQTEIDTITIWINEGRLNN